MATTTLLDTKHTAKQLLGDKPICCDERYSEWVLQHRQEQKDDLIRLVNGEDTLIKLKFQGEWGCGIPHHFCGRMYFFKRGWAEPVPCGIWMGFPEPHWHITSNQWDSMNKEEQAEFEANEQLDKWVEKEYYELWLTIYAPEVADKIWWNGGATITVSGTKEQRQELRDKYEYAAKCIRAERLKQ
jgi:hypothetical protein